MFAAELTAGFELLRGSHWWFSLVQGVNLRSHVCLVYLPHSMVRRELRSLNISVKAIVAK